MKIDLQFPRSSHSLKNCKEILDNLFKEFSIPEENFLTVLSNKEVAQKAIDLAGKFKSKKNFYHVGIGGSSLGPEMLVSSFSHNKNFIFLNNSDPQLIQKKVDAIKFEDSLFYFVSKSGTTAETMAIFDIIVGSLLEKGIKKEDLKNYMVFCTDPINGDLRKISDQYSISCLTVPIGVGGRFSVLTQVGFFPAAFAGIDILSMQKSAKDFSELLFKDPYFLNLSHSIVHQMRNGINQTVLMPYCSRLKTLSSWFVQLWAESLGKNGQGLTPIQALGATDQHSQLQLFSEGPKDKLILFVEVLDHGANPKIQNHLQIPSLEKLAGKTLNKLIKGQLDGVIQSLKDLDIPVCKLSIEKLDENSLGQLIIFFELLTCMVGSLLKINPFNQPGVESAKKYALEYLSRD